MKQLTVLVLLLSTSLCSYTQSIDFTIDPQPDLVQVYGGSFASGDIDHDGDSDLLVAGITPGRETVLYLNDGIGSFSEVEDTPFPKASGSITIFEDLDDDGDLDLFFSGNGFGVQKFAHVYVNSGQGVFTQLPNPSLPSFADGAVDLADIDGDADLDLLISARAADGELFADVFLNDGNAIFTASDDQPFTPIEFGHLTFLDVENDGDADVIIAGTQEDETGITALYINDGAGNFAADLNNAFVQLAADDVDAFDSDNDGDMDILMSGLDDQSTAHTNLYINDGSGQFSLLEETILQNTFAGANCIADFDNDGDEDLAIIGSQDGGVPNIYNIVYENMGDNLFNPVDTIGGEYIAACVVEDFNGDAYKDIIIQGFAENTSVYWNTSLPASLEDWSLSPLVSVYPNPSDGVVNVIPQSIASQPHLGIYTVDGRMVYQANFSKQTRGLSVDLSPGTYLLVLSSGDSTVASKRLVVR